MSFEAKNLSVLAYANGFTLWHFTSADTDISGAGYFNEASDMLRVGDIVIANVDTDGDLATKIYTVTGNSTGVVTIADYTAV